jgi:adenylosuccinate lyase
MREIWSQNGIWTSARDVWIAVAATQAEAGIVTNEQVQDLINHRDELSVDRIWELERQKEHDVAAAIAHYAEVAPIGGAILHLGCTSEDVLSNVEVLQIQTSIDLVRTNLVGVLGSFGDLILQHKDLICMGYTHLQAAEPTTMGYRFAKYAQDLVFDLINLDQTRNLILAKGIKGAVGTSASFQSLFAGTTMTPQEFEKKVMARLGLDYALIADQTYPRKGLLFTENILAAIGASLHRFAFDMTFLQSSPFDEVGEKRRKGTIGSSAMPHKKNPINFENIGALTSSLPGILATAWNTAAFVNLERTLRDSAGKRDWLPQSFLIIDEVLRRIQRVMPRVEVHPDSIATNLNKFAPFLTTEILLGKLTQAGMDRQVAHEILVGHAEVATDARRKGQENPMQTLVSGDARITALLQRDVIEQAFVDVFQHVGIAPELCIEFVENQLKPAISRI